MIRFDPTKHIPGIFNQRVLKAAARAQKRPLIPSSESNRVKRPFHALVGARRNAPERMKSIQTFFATASGRNPHRFYFASERLSRHGERKRNGLVRNYLVVEIANQANPDRPHDCPFIGED